MLHRWELYSPSQVPRCQERHSSTRFSLQPDTLSHVWTRSKFHFTKDVANYAKNRLPYRVKVAVLHTYNPFHMPDAFEKEAILELRKRKGEVWKVVRDGEEPLFRFAAPITFRRECGNCHGEFKGVQGCISIAFPAIRVFRGLFINRFYITLYLLGSLVVVFALLWLFLRFLVFNPSMFLPRPLKGLKGETGR